MSAFNQQIMCIVFSAVSLIISQFSTIPQLFNLKKTRNTSGISLITYIVFVFTSIFWSAWSYMFYYNQMIQGEPEGVSRAMHMWGMIPTIIMNNANLLIMSVVLGIKLYHLHLCKKMHVTELELSKIMLDKDNGKYHRFGKFEGCRRYLVQIIIMTLFVLILGSTTAVIYLWGTPDSTWTAIPQWIVIACNAIGAVTWEAVSWPQFIKSMREKDTTGVSLAWAIFLPVSCTVLFFSDLLQGLAAGSFDYSIICSLIFNGMISAYAVLGLKIKNIKDAKKMHLSEKEYTKKVLVPLVEKKKAEKLASKQKVNKKPIVVKKQHPYRVVGITIAITLIVGALITMALTLLA